MAEVLSYIMPDQIREEVLEDWENILVRPSRSSPLQKAKRRFVNALCEHSGKSPNNIDIRHYGALGRTSGEVRDNEVHVDLPVGRKYLLSIARANRSTIHYPNWQAEVDTEVTAEELFKLDDTGLFVPSKHADFEWFQAENGQLSYIEMATDYHSASPLYLNEFKILLSAVVAIN